MISNTAPSSFSEVSALVLVIDISPCPSQSKLIAGKSCFSIVSSITTVSCIPLTLEEKNIGVLCVILVVPLISILPVGIEAGIINLYSSSSLSLETSFPLLSMTLMSLNAALDFLSMKLRVVSDDFISPVPISLNVFVSN